MMVVDEERSALLAAVRPFERASTLRAAMQLVTSLGFYIVLVAMMYWSFSYSYWLTLALSPVAGGLLIRTFIVQHDCGHGSFFPSPFVNNIVGAVCGAFTLAPYQSWRHQHARHHSNWNNLDRRESGLDIYSTCLTVNEYRALSPRRRFFYRLVRHPLVAHVTIPPLVFLVLYRMPFDTPKDRKIERRSVHLTNLSVAAIFIGLGWAFGFSAVLMVQLPIVLVTTIVGVWLFSVQHRFAGSHWLRQSEWSFQAAAMTGTSYLRLPRPLQWFTGNIGFHHIHHLSPRVPNYRLEECHRSSELLAIEPPLTLRRALAAGNLALWDELRQKLVAFSDAEYHH